MFYMITREFINATNNENLYIQYIYVFFNIFRYYTNFSLPLSMLTLLILIALLHHHNQDFSLPIHNNNGYNNFYHLIPNPLKYISLLLDIYPLNTTNIHMIHYEVYHLILNNANNTFLIQDNLEYNL